MWLRDLLLLLLRLDVSSSPPPPPPPRRASRLASSSPPKPVDAAVLRRGARLGASPRPKLDMVCVCVRGEVWLTAVSLAVVGSARAWSASVQAPLV